MCGDKPGIQHWLRHKPPNILHTRRTRQAALVRPELPEAQHALHQLVQAQRPLDLRLGVVEADHGGWHLRDKGVLYVARLHANSKHGLLVTGGVDVHEVQLGARAVVVDGVVGGRMDVPPGEVDGLVVVGQRRVGGVHALFSLDDGEGGPVGPVVEVAQGLVGVVEGGDVVQREAVVNTQADGALTGTCLTDLVCCFSTRQLVRPTIPKAFFPIKPQYLKGKNATRSGTYLDLGVPSQMMPHMSNLAPEQLEDLLRPAFSLWCLDGSSRAVHMLRRRRPSRGPKEGLLHTSRRWTAFVWWTFGK